MGPAGADASHGRHPASALPGSAGPPRERQARGAPAFARGRTEGAEFPSARRKDPPIRIPLALALLAFATTPAHGATFTVTRADDAGATSCAPDDCTLRAAILVANTNPGPDTIAFAIPTAAPGDVAVVTIDSPLPALTDAETTIDGFTQPGAVAVSDGASPQGFPHTLAVTLQPRTAKPYPYVGLVLRGSGHRVQGLAIRDFYYAQIDVWGAGHVVVRNLLGLDPRGLGYYAVEPFFGIRLRRTGSAPVHGNRIGGASLEGNVIANVATAISLVGIDARDAPNVIAGNLIGIAPDGRTPLTLVRGIELRDSSGAIVGRPLADPALAGNVIGGVGPPGSIGIDIERGRDHVVEGNLIGGTNLPVVLPHRIDTALRIASATGATMARDNTSVAPIRASEGASTPRVSFARGLTVALDAGFAGASVLVRREGDASAPASVDVAGIDGLANPWFDTDPPALAAGGVVTLHWPAGDATPRTLAISYRGPPGSGPYGGMPGPPPYGAELTLVLRDARGIDLGANAGHRFVLHHHATARIAERYDALFGGPTAGMEDANPAP